jgi:hypothetical protein
MRVFASDVGCKNLSYCIIDYNEKDKTLKILDWNLINLCSIDNTCCKIMRNKKPCCKIAHYYENGDNVNHYCTTHKTKLCKKIKIKDQDNLYSYGRNMYDFFDNNSLILQCDKYVIENQPSMKNPKMKSISMLLYSYFVLNKKSNILFIHPTSKLKICEDLTKEIFKLSKNKNDKYKITKNLSIQYTTNILDNEISENIKWVEKLLSEKKQDDLCDAFLHGYFTIFGKNCKSKINDNEFYNYIYCKFNYN